MGSFLSDTLLKAFSSKYVYFKIHDSNVAYIQNLQEGKRHQKKRDIKSIFQSCVVTNLSSSSCFCFCSFCFWVEISNSWILNDIGRNSGRKIAKFLMSTFTCRSAFPYAPNTPPPPPPNNNIGELITQIHLLIAPGDVLHSYWPLLDLPLWSHSIQYINCIPF